VSFAVVPLATVSGKFRPETGIMYRGPFHQTYPRARPSGIDRPSRDRASPTEAMKLPMLLAGLIACLINNVAATALTYKLGANEKACFYATTKKEAEKIAFYFAVRLPSQPASPHRC
jgi:hypothetical protein